MQILNSIIIHHRPKKKQCRIRDLGSASEISGSSSMADQRGLISCTYGEELGIIDCSRNRIFQNQESLVLRSLVHCPKIKTKLERDTIERQVEYNCQGCAMGVAFREAKLDLRDW